MAKNSNMIWVFGIASFLVLGVIALFMFGGNGLSTSEGLPTDPVTGEVLLTSGTCEIVPTVVVNVRDKEAVTTSLTTDEVYRVDGVYYDTLPTLAKGQRVEVLANATGYLDVIGVVESTICGANNLYIETQAYQAPTVEFKEDSTTLTDSATGGASNGTAVTAGGSESFKFTAKGVEKKTTGQTILVVELGTEKNVSTVNIYDGTGKSLAEADVPQFYVDTLSSPYTQAYVLPAIENAIEMEYSMLIVADSGDTISGAVYVTAYVGEALADSQTGEFLPFGVEDSEDVANYEATWDYDFFLD